MGKEFMIIYYADDTDVILEDEDNLQYLKNAEDENW